MATDGPGLKTTSASQVYSEVVPKRLIESDHDYVRQAFRSCVEQLLARDRVLILVAAHEQAISHRLAVYLEPWFSTYNVDCEYNRLGFHCKRGPDTSWFRPDIIVHDRTYPDSNLLVVDIKCTTNDEEGESENFIYMTQDGNNFAYSFGVFITFYTKRRELHQGIRADGFWRDRRKIKRSPFNRIWPISDEERRIVECRLDGKR